MEEVTGMDTSDVVREENAKQAVIFVWCVIGCIAFGIVTELSMPDNRKTLKMWSALRVKRFAQSVADRSQQVASWSATVYNREKA